jgi:chain length determinant protein (polysaccharide antigen chain regulator)
METNQQDLAHLRPENSDEIDLGELLRKLIGEWKLVTAVTLLGAVASVVIALQQTSIYRVEAILTAPSIAELGAMIDQQLVPIDSEKAMEKVVEGLFSVQNQRTVFEQSELLRVSSLNSETNANELFNDITKSLLINRIDREFYSMTGTDRPPFKEVSVSFESPNAPEAAEFVNALAVKALATALKTFKEDALARKSDQINQITTDLKGLEDAAKQSRLAEITRLEEANSLASETLQLELRLLQEQAKSDRLRRIAQLEEAIITASGLKIVEPMSWETLRPAKSIASGQNTVSAVAETQPLYFQGTRLLTAERDMLIARTNDQLYLTGAAELRLELKQLATDPKIASLKQRKNDAIYIENYDELISKQSVLTNLSVEFSIARMATLAQPAIASTQPVKPNRKLIAVAGTVLAGFLGLFFALIRIAIKK